MWVWKRPNSSRLFMLGNTNFFHSLWSIFLKKNHSSFSFVVRQTKSINCCSFQLSEYWSTDVFDSLKFTFFFFSITYTTIKQYKRRKKWSDYHDITGMNYTMLSIAIKKWEKKSPFQFNLFSFYWFTRLSNEISFVLIFQLLFVANVPFYQMSNLCSLFIHDGFSRIESAWVWTNDFFIVFFLLLFVVFVKQN